MIVTKIDFAIENMQDALATRTLLFKEGTLPVNGEIKQISEKLKTLNSLSKQMEESLTDMKKIDLTRREHLDAITESVEKNEEVIKT